MHTGNVSKPQKGGKHEVKQKFFKNLPSHISNAVMYIERDNGELTVITDQPMLDANDEPSLIIAGIHKDEKLDNEFVNRVASVYPLDHLFNQLDDAARDGVLIITNKNRANDILTGVGVYSSERTKIIGSAVDNISQVNTESQEKSATDENGISPRKRLISSSFAFTLPIIISGFPPPLPPRASLRSFPVSRTSALLDETAYL